MTAVPSFVDDVASEWRPGPEDEPPPLMRMWTMAELLAADRTFSWLAKGLLVTPTFGIHGGEKKSLKSYISTFVAIGVAAGKPIFDWFTVPEARPVIVFVGEGGRIPYTRRLERIADAMGVSLADIPLFSVFDVSAIESTKFRTSLHSFLAEVGPGLVQLDPLYAYHGSKRSGASLYEEGELLSMLSVPCVESGACLQVVNHFNRGGSAKGLDRITMAGGSEWSDTWTFSSHRDNPDVENGRFRLLYEIGSRQWGGRTWELDLDIGRFDDDNGHHDGDITWDLRPHHGSGKGVDSKAEATETYICEALADLPFQLTKTELYGKVKGNKDRFEDVFRRLVDENRIVSEDRRRLEGRRETTRPVWAVASAVSAATEDF